MGMSKLLFIAKGHKESVMEIENLSTYLKSKLLANVGIPKETLYKNRLQEFTQRANIAYPVYHTTNEGGLQHLPQFRCSVEVDGETYTSRCLFTNKKAAEQDAANVALEGISKKIKDCISKKTSEGGFPPIYEDKVFCKSILHEFAAKMNIEKPKYDTDRKEGLIPVFTSSVVFDGIKYVGGPSVNKKEAEQLAARAVILSILANSGVGTHLSEIIKSKAKFFSVVHEPLNANVETGLSPLQRNSETALGSPAIKGDSKGTSQTGAVISDGVALPLLEQSSSKKSVFEGADQAGNVIKNVATGILEGESHVLLQHELRDPVLQISCQGTSQVDNVIGSVVSEVVLEEQSHVQPRHEFRKPVLETYSPAVPLPITFVQSLQDQIPLDTSACGGTRKSKKRRRSKKKGKINLETQVSEVPLSEGMPCFVSQ